MKQKRDAKGRFVKTKPSYEELESKILMLEGQIECLNFQLKHVNLQFDSNLLFLSNLRHVIDVADASIDWLLDRVPVWTKKKFRAFHVELMNSHGDLKAVSDDMKEYKH